MRAVVLTFLGLAALGAVSVQAAPIAVPAKPIAVEMGAAPSIAGPPRLRPGLAPRRIARPLGLLTLGTLRSELVISLGRHSELTSTYSCYIGSKESEG
jgi:hypothetical protein